jgi:hypothetical protein
MGLQGGFDEGECESTRTIDLLESGIGKLWTVDANYRSIRVLERGHEMGV